MADQAFANRRPFIVLPRAQNPAIGDIMREYDDISLTCDKYMYSLQKLYHFSHAVCNLFKHLDHSRHVGCSLRDVLE